MCEQFFGFAELSEFLTEKRKNMVKTVEEYQKEIEKALKDHKLYSKGLTAQIKSLASAMRNLDLANADIDKLESTTVLETTRYGEKLAPHPVFKIAKDAQDMITRQMKALGLTAEDLAGKIEEDPLTDLTKKLTRKRKKPEVIIPTD